jgi:hypothetical protein
VRLGSSCAADRLNQRVDVIEVNTDLAGSDTPSAKATIFDPAAKGLD